jgi:predicted amidohydrolase YtcJ
LCCEKLGIQPGSRGHANFDASDVTELLCNLYNQGWQVMTHAQGDRGSREIIDLYEKVLTASNRRDHRWRLEHCALIGDDDLARAARLGVTVSFHVNHVYYYGPELRDAILGPDRAEGVMPLTSALLHGHRISQHADSPMYPADPLKLMQTAITRRTRTEETLGAERAITAEQALRAVTIDAAWQLFADDRIGSIERGKYADFTILERDPLTVPPEYLGDVAVLGTWSGGVPTEGEVQLPPLPRGHRQRHPGRRLLRPPGRDPGQEKGGQREDATTATGLQSGQPGVRERPQSVH